MNIDLLITNKLVEIEKRFTVKRDTAFEIFSMSVYLDLPYDEIFNDILIKGQERGIDGIDFKTNSNYTYLTVFQCKNKSNLSDNDIRKFKNDVEDIFNIGNPKDLPNLKDLIPKINQYKIFAEKYIIKQKLVFIFNGDKNDKNTKNKVICSQYNTNDYVIWDKFDIFNKVTQISNLSTKKKDIRFIFNPEKSNISHNNNFPQDIVSFEIKDIKAVMFRISALTICKLLDEEEQINGDYQRIFSDNIREFLGDNFTNKKISDTINSSNKEFFPFLNNGITLICDNFDLPENLQAGKFIIPVTNPTIINGLQTTNVIYRSYKNNPQLISNIYLTIKLFETRQPEIIDLITEATNTQTPITFIDKLSNRKFNQFTQELFKNKGVRYITKKNELYKTDYQASQPTISSNLALKIWISTFYEKPELFYVSDKDIFEEIYLISVDNSHLINKLFNGEINSNLYTQIYLCFIFYHIYHKIKTDLSLSNEFLGLLFFGTYKLVEKDLDKLDNLQIINSMKQAHKIIYDNLINERQGQNRPLLSYYFANTKSRLDFNIKAGITFQSLLEISKINDYKVNIDNLPI